MSKAYLKGREDWFPDAESVIDRFHVKKLLLDAMEIVRREERGLPKYKKGMLERKRLMIPQGKCTPSQARKVSLISQACPKTGRAYRMVQALDLVYGCATVQGARTRLKELISWMRRSRLEPMKRAAMTLRLHQTQILGYFTAKLTNALAEGINSLVQAAKRKAETIPDFV
jgi:transposase